MDSIARSWCANATSHLGVDRLAAEENRVARAKGLREEGAAAAHGAQREGHPAPALAPVQGLRRLLRAAKTAVVYSTVPDGEMVTSLTSAFPSAVSQSGSASFFNFLIC